MHSEIKSKSKPSQTLQRISDSKTASRLHVSENAQLNFPGARLVHTKSQRAAILRLLLDAHGTWVPLPAILELGIAQYGARILELRRTGFSIENKIERLNRVRHSWFRLVPSPAQQTPERDAELNAAPSFELVP